MARERKGMVLEKDGKIYARVPYRKPDGKWSALVRRAKNKSEAKEICRRLIHELDAGDAKPKTDQLKFSDLATYYLENYCQEAEYVDGRKVAGMRSSRTAKYLVGVLVKSFGSRLLRSITHGDLLRYKSARLKAQTVQGHQRTIASVNRELATARRMFNIAVREGWLKKSPFAAGDSLISTASERKRERILTRDEERRLLDQCIGRRFHLRPILIAALDTGAREGELLSLTWEGVDFDLGFLRFSSFKGKTRTERIVGMTDRLKLELVKLWNQSPGSMGTLVFGIKTNLHKGFWSARRLAGLDDVRFHDLRHTAATRMVAGQLPLSEVGRILGHSIPSTTYRYVNANLETAHKAAAVLDKFNQVEELEEESWLTQ